jgi:hypothetical protein
MKDFGWKEPTDYPKSRELVLCLRYGKCYKGYYDVGYQTWHNEHGEITKPHYWMKIDTKEEIKKVTEAIKRIL